jgi:polyisoprenoid-binding protein YceI
MGNTGVRRRILKILINRFEFSALLLIVAAAPWTHAAAQATSAAQPAQKRATAPPLPPPGTYNVDPRHSFAFFGARHHVVGLVRGRFDKVTGTIAAAQDPAACSVDITIDVSTVSTQVAERDEDLRSPEYFDVKKFPTMTYRGRGIRRASATSWIMDGDLTLHGVTRRVPLTFTFNGAFADTKAGEPARVVFHGTAATKRVEYGIGARDNLDELGTLQTPDVAIEIDVEADEVLPEH